VTATIRIDVDYVPWDSAYTAEFGHGEPAMLLKLLDFARINGYEFHFFVSSRVMAALPSALDAILNERHALDWLCRRPATVIEDFGRAQQDIKRFDHKWQGLGFVSGVDSSEAETLPQDLQFVVTDHQTESFAGKVFPENGTREAPIARYQLGRLSVSDAKLIRLSDEIQKTLTDRQLATLRAL